MQDVITRSITVKATQERVFKALTDSKEIVSWFPDSIEGGTLEVDQEPIFSFSGGKHRRRIHIEAVNPYEYFAYRWAPGEIGLNGIDLQGIPNTFVEFFVEKLEDGTKVTVKESGFASLPSEYAEKSLHENNNGWDFIMNRFETTISNF